MYELTLTHSLHIYIHVYKYTCKRNSNPAPPSSLRAWSADSVDSTVSTLADTPSGSVSGTNKTDTGIDTGIRMSTSGDFEVEGKDSAVEGEGSPEVGQEESAQAAIERANNADPLYDLYGGE